MHPLLIALAIFAFYSGFAQADDADTLTIDGKEYTLDGVDAPEIDQACLDADGEVYLCGRVAAQALATFVAGRAISCEELGVDPKHPNKRTGQCSVDGVDVNRWLVEKGWALNFEPSARGRFKEFEAEARAGHFGMWKGCFVAPQDFRHWRKHAAKLLGATCPADARTKLFPDDPKMPGGCEIKGKYALRAWPYLGIYHMPSCGSYRRTTKPDRWFCSEDDALAAGFRSSYTCWLR